MEPTLLTFLVFEAVAFLCVGLALTSLAPAQRPLLVAVLTMLVPWIFGGPGFHCDHYQLRGPLAHMAANPLDLRGEWLAFPWALLGARALVARLDRTRLAAVGPQVPWLRVLGLWVAATVLLRVAGPAGDMGRIPVVIIGWFMTNVLAYLGARGIVERLLPRFGAAALVQVVLALLVATAVCIPVETFGTVAGLWAWRAPMEHESWFYGAVDASACPPFVPFPEDGLLPFPVDEALAGWCLRHLLAPIVLLTLLERPPRTLAALVVRVLVALSPLLVIAAQLAVAGWWIERSAVGATREQTAGAQWLASLALPVAALLVARWMLRNRPDARSGAELDPAAARRDRRLTAAAVALELTIVLLVVLARSATERPGYFFALGVVAIALAGVLIARGRLRRRAARAAPRAAVAANAPMPLPRAALVLCTVALACMAICLVIELAWLGAADRLWTVAPLGVVTVAVGATAAFGAGRSAREQPAA